MQKTPPPKKNNPKNNKKPTIQYVAAYCTSGQLEYIKKKKIRILHSCPLPTQRQQGRQGMEVERVSVLQKGGGGGGGSITVLT